MVKRIKGNKNRWILVFILCIIILSCYFIHFLVPYNLGCGIILSNANNFCIIIKDKLRTYYSEHETNLNSPKGSDFFNYLHERTGLDQFSNTKPVVPYTSKYDFEFYLVLPKKLVSEKKLLIGYSFLLKCNKLEFGFCLFLNGMEIECEPISKEDFMKIISKEKLMNKKPDFYYWHRRNEYLKKQISNQKNRM